MAIFSAPEDNRIWFSQPPPQPRRQIQGTVTLSSPSFTLTPRRARSLHVPEHEPCTLVPLPMHQPPLLPRTGQMNGRGSAKRCS